MVSVARSATGGREMAPLRHRLPMDAGAVLFKLVGRYLVGGHSLCVGMAPRARLGHAQRMDRRLAVLHRANVVDAVAIDAGGNVVVAARQAFPMDAGLVQLELVYALAWRILAHVVGSA